MVYRTNKVSTASMYVRSMYLCMCLIYVVYGLYAGIVCIYCMYCMHVLYVCMVAYLGGFCTYSIYEAHRSGLPAQRGPL